MTVALSILAFNLAFVATHLAPAHPPIRAALVARLGTGAYLGLYSLVSFATMGPAAGLWWVNLHGGPMFWALRGGVWTALATAIGALGLALAVGGLATPAPTSMGKDAVLARDTIEVRGASAITRHPVSIGSALLGVAHLIGNGWATDVAWWVGLPLVGVLGALHQDARKAAEHPGYRAFMAETSVLPFARPGNLGRVGGRAWAAMAVGAGIALGARWLHP